MKKNLVWITLILNLVSVGALCVWLMVRPAEVRAVFSMDQETAERAFGVLFVQGDSDVPPGFPDVAPIETASGDSPSTGSLQAAPRPGQSVSTADTAPPPPRRKGPPPRRSGDPGEVTDPATEPVVARYLGDWKKKLPPTPPPPELYPFRVDRRRFPDADTIEVDLSIQNASGYYWKDVKLVMRSAGYPRAIAFDVGRWRIDQIAELTYRFPSVALSRRMDKLRVVAIIGEREQSTLSEHVGELRAQLAEQYGSGEDVVGALGDSADASAGAALVALPGGFHPLDSATCSGGLPEVSGDETIELLMADACAAAVDAQDHILALVDGINAEGFSGEFDASMAEHVAGAVDARARFDQLGLDLALTLSRSSDESVRTLTAHLNEWSSRLFVLIDSVEGQIQAIDPDFSLGSRGGT